MSAGNEQMHTVEPLSEEVVAAFDAAITAMPGAVKRPMFGFACAFINGQMFTGLSRAKATILMRLSSDDLAAVLAMEGAHLYEPMPGRPMREYAVMPQEIAASPKKVGAWLQKSFAYAQTLPPKIPKPKSRKKA